MRSSIGEVKVVCWKNYGDFKAEIPWDPPLEGDQISSMTRSQRILRSYQLSFLLIIVEDLPEARALVLSK